jgi:hypothetical protein
MAKLSGGWIVKSDAGMTHAKAAKDFLDGSCRCICGGPLSNGARAQPVLALIWTHATFNEAVGALPVCRANDPRSSRCVTGGDALQASTAVPFDEMAKARFLIERPAIIIAD